MEWMSVGVFFFFFQAEDGIRDGRVTGVQTCALPIYCRRRGRKFWGGAAAAFSRRGPGDVSSTRELEPKGVLFRVGVHEDERQLAPLRRDGGDHAITVDV